jgi:hypothetical protein
MYFKPKAPMTSIAPLLTKNNISIEFTKDRPISLTAIWKMEGSPESQTPNKWKILPTTKKLITQVKKNVKGGKSSFEAGSEFKDIIKTTRGGNNPETVAHWKLALEYAAYLNIETKSWMLGIVGDYVESPEDFAANILITSHNKERVERAKKRVLVCDTNKQAASLASEWGVPHAQVHNDRYRGLYQMNAKQLRVEGGLSEKDTPLNALSEYDLTLNSLANMRAKMLGNPNAMLKVSDTLRRGHKEDFGSDLKPTWEEKLLSPSKARTIAYANSYQMELAVVI